ncbi:unnamed protein product, partial [Mycena citricolor]
PHLALTPTCWQALVHLASADGPNTPSYSTLLRPRCISLSLSFQSTTLSAYYLISPLESVGTSAMSPSTGATVHNRAYALALSASLGSLFYGFDIGLIGGVLAMKSFQEYIGLQDATPSMKASIDGNIVISLQIGCLVGALSVGYFSGRFGRKSCLQASGLIFVLGSALQVVVGWGNTQRHALQLLYIGRFIGGIGVGMVSALVPAYVAECTPPAIRGRCTGFIQLANNIGVMLSFWVNYFCARYLPSGESQWRLPFAVQIVPALIFLLCLPWQPESPRFMIETERYDRAAEILAYLAHTTTEDPLILATVEEVNTDFLGKRRLPLMKQLQQMNETHGIALRCFIPSLVMLFQQLTGTNAINYFSPMIFASLGIGETTSGLFATGIYGIVKVISVCVGLALAVEGIGRKMSLIYGGLGQCIAMLWIGVYTGLHPGTKPNNFLGYISIAAVYLYAAFFSVGWGPIPWVLAGEVAPNHLRTAVMSLAAGMNWTFATVVAKLTPPHACRNRLWDIPLVRILLLCHIVLGVALST